MTTGVCHLFLWDVNRKGTTLGLLPLLSRARQSWRAEIPLLHWCVKRRTCGTKNVKRPFTFAKRGLILTLSLFAAVYVGDYLWLRYRMLPGKTGPVETLKIQRTYAVPRKDGRTEFVFGDPETVTCVHALFPHLGYSPCWYVKRNVTKPIPISVFVMWHR
jgi:hypothetical protein